jgi:hypothetical protein
MLNHFQHTMAIVQCPSIVYDPCVWDVLQHVLDHITDIQIYRLSSADGHPIAVTSSSNSQSTIVDQFDTLLNALNEPDGMPKVTDKIERVRRARLHHVDSTEHDYNRL